MEGREAMAFPGAGAGTGTGTTQPPFYFPRGAFTSISSASSSQSASALHAPPALRPPMSNPNSSFFFGEQQRHPHPHHQEFVSHGIHMGMAPSSPTMQQQQPPPIPPSPSPPVAATEPVFKKKRGRPRKYAADNNQVVALGLSPMSSSSQKLKSSSSSVYDPNEPKRARGRPPGTGRKQRLANLGEWMNTSAGLAFAPHVISVEAGEDIVSKVFSFSIQRPRALCIISGTGKVSSVTLNQPVSSVPSLSFQGSFDILSLGGSYLVNEEGGSKSRTGGLSVSLFHPDGFVFGGRVGTLIAADLVQIMACSFVYGSTKAKAIKLENGSNEDTTPISERLASPAAATATESGGEEDQTPQDFSSPGWSGSGGGKRSIDSRNHNHMTDINLTRG